MNKIHKLKEEQLLKLLINYNTLETDKNVHFYITLHFLPAVVVIL